MVEKPTERKIIKSIYLFLIFLIILLSTSSLAQQSSGDSYMRGQMLYVDFCVRCHLPDGTGETGLIPPLANADFLQDIQATVRKVSRRH